MGWSVKKILLCGGVGYIGGAIFKHFKPRTDIEATTVDLEWFGNHVNPDNIRQDYNSLSTEFIQRYDIVILLSAFSSPAICNNSGYSSVIMNNVVNFEKLLPKLKPTQKFIYMSSITVYNGITDTKIEEDATLIKSPMENLYDFTKQDCDRIIQEYPDVQFYGLRLATVCGVSENWRTDIMVNAMTDTALATSEVKVFNPRNNKPILHVRDLCKAIDAIIHCEDDKRGFYNLASYNGITEEIAEVVAAVTRSKLHLLSSKEMATHNLPTTSYDLSVSTKKFEQAFDFKFEGSTEDITREIVKKIDTVHKTKRVNGIKYG